MLDKEDVVRAVADARRRDGEFFHNKLKAENGPGGGSEGKDKDEDNDVDGDRGGKGNGGYDSDKSVDKWGVKADLEPGVHKS